MQAAMRQGKEWEMATILFKNGRALADEQLEGYAKEIGLKVDQWKTDFASDAVKKEIADDMKAAQASGQVRGTPTILINGAKFTQQRTLEGFKVAIDAEIKKADALLKKGVKIQDVYKKLSSGG
jgi:predicted DsbA family dithiol-disulfide isomerase